MTKTGVSKSRSGHSRRVTPLLKNISWLPGHLGPFPKLGVWRPTEIWPFLQGDRAPVLCTGLGRPSLCPQGMYACFRRLGQQWGAISKLPGMPAGIGAPWLAEWVKVGDMGICTSPLGSVGGGQPGMAGIPPGFCAVVADSSLLSQHPTRSTALASLFCCLQTTEGCWQHTDPTQS